MYIVIVPVKHSHIYGYTAGQHMDVRKSLEGETMLKTSGKTQVLDML